MTRLSPNQVLLYGAAAKLLMEQNDTARLAAMQIMEARKRNKGRMNKAEKKALKKARVHK